MAERREEHRRRTYGRRAGHRLSRRQAGLVSDLLPRIAVPLAREALRNPRELFDNTVDGLWLEIGFGGGEHLFRQAQDHPDRGLIGCEPFINGVAKLLTMIAEAGIDNIRIHAGDARDLLDLLPGQCLERVFILYPDPWPKTRHNKRRFITMATLDQLARIMEPGAELRFASDIPDYVRWTLAHMRRHGGFEWLANRASDWRRRPDDWPATRYETKALEAGRVPFYLSFRKVS